MVQFRFDHAIIAVNDLDTALADYRALGFNAVYGGEHASGTTHNALIVFKDGSYLELLALTGRTADPTSDATDFSPLLATGEGLVGFALGVDNLDAVAAAMRQRGVDSVGAAQAGKRQRADGVALEWKTVSVNGSMSPFFIEDVTARNLRVPDNTTTTTHDNGAVGIAAATFNFADVDVAAARYTDLLGSQPTATEHGLVIELPQTRLLLNPEGDGSTKPTTAPYRLLIATNTPNNTGLIRMDQAHGARLLLVDAGH